MRFPLRLITWMSALLLTTLATMLSGKQDLPNPLLVPYGLPNVHYGSLDLGDYDLDGDLDLVVTGMTGSGPLTRIFRLDDSLFILQRGEQVDIHHHKTFRPVDAVLNQVSRGSARWGDYDGDGDLDILLTGLAMIQEDVDVTVQEIVTVLYENRAGVFVQDRSFELPRVFNGSVSWGDYDVDGDLDAVVSGATNPEEPYDPATYVLRNEDGKLIQSAADLPGTMFGDADWADVDGDGDLDLALLGQTSGLPIFGIWRNDGADTFTPLTLNFSGLAFGSVAWGDYDDDGDPDLVVTGGRLGPKLFEGETYVLRNDEDEQFTDVSTEIADVMQGDAEWADFDLDGRLDLAVFGVHSSLGEETGWIYLNDGNDRFLPRYRIVGLLFGSMSVGDYNGDGDVDFIMSGRTLDGQLRTGFYMNVVIPEPIPDDLFPR